LKLRLAHLEHHKQAAHPDKFDIELFQTAFDNREANVMIDMLEDCQLLDPYFIRGKKSQLCAVD